jgi:hypothetical protein
MAHAPWTTRFGDARQTDLFVQDVQCNSVLWFAEQKRGRDGELLDEGIRPRIIGVVDVPVPYPLLRVVFRAFPGSQLIDAVWDEVMPPPVEENERRFSTKNPLFRPLFRTDPRSKRAAAIPKTNFMGEQLNEFWKFALAARNRESEEYGLTPCLLDPPEPNLANIVVDTDLTNNARKLYNVASWRLHMAKHYSKLFGAYAMAFKRLDMREATISETMANAIFDDVVAKRIHRRPRSYGWYVIKRYWLPVWALRNWLWKTSVARNYAPGAPGYLEDLKNCDEFVDDGLTIDIDDDAFDAVDAVGYDPIDCEFDKILGKRPHAESSDDRGDSDSEFEDVVYVVPATKRVCRNAQRHQSDEVCERGVGVSGSRRALVF